MMKPVLYLTLAFFTLVFTVQCATLRAPNQVQEAGPGVITVADPSIYSRVFVISDVHGMYDNVLRVLQAGGVIDTQANWAAGNSLLVITGDSIDKGAKSIEVMDLWIKLQGQARSVGGELVHTLGNHEAEFLANPSMTNKKAVELIAEMQSLRIPMSDLTMTITSRGQFIHSEPVALRVGTWLFCHSGFYPDMRWDDFSAKAQQVIGSQSYDDDFLIGSNSILETKKWEQDPSLVKGLLSRMNQMGLYGIVFGHQPGAFGIQGRSAAKAQGRLIKIDNGMAPEAGGNPGSLLVFTSPKQMRGYSYPVIKVISANGSQKTLVPE